MRLGIVTYEKIHECSDNIPNEDNLVIDGLKESGLVVHHLVWDDNGVDWSSYDLIIIKSVWDYFDKVEKWYNWLNYLKNLKIKVLNSLDIIEWNSNKEYLLDIKSKGFKIIPTKIPDISIPLNLDIFNHLNTEEVIIKPLIGGSSKNVFKITKDTFKEVYHKKEKIIHSGPFMIQPFVKSISKGEKSFVFIDGKYSHSVKKIPKENEFRVQHLFGGKVEEYFPTQNEIIIAEEYYNEFGKNSIHGRVDLIEYENELTLMELELIEPYLFLFLNKKYISRYTQSVMKNIL